MSAIHHLVDTTPAWFVVQSIKSDALVGRALVPKTPWASMGLLLRIFGDPTPRVREDAPGTNLPKRCPERHIQEDETFCVGLRYIDVLSAEQATQWWEQLRQFIICQGVAERTRRWPESQAVDHGDAGWHHERALALAAEADVVEEYAGARLGEPSWLTNPSLRLFDKKGSPINGRAVCPRGCLRRARGRLVPITRRDCEKRKKTGCHKRRLLVDLAFTEQQRRKALAEYWEHVFKSGLLCCRTMRGCPLAEHEDRQKSAGGEKP